jgi:hypothetical protein
MNKLMNTQNDIVNPIKMHINCKFTHYIIRINIKGINNFSEVAKLKKAFLFLLSLAFIFSFDVRALADGDHSKNIKQATENFKNGSSNDPTEMEGMDHGSGTDMEGMDHDSGADMEGMNHDSDTDMEGMNHDSDTVMEGMNHDSGTDMEGMDMEEGSGGAAHDHHAAVVEVPPNYKVLGTYGAVNLLFILIGVWNKWIRRKGDLNNGHA